MDQRRAMKFLRCALALCVWGATSARGQEPTPEPSVASVAPAATATPAATASPAATPASTPANGTPAPSSSPKMLYPSTSMSSLFGSSAGGESGLTGLTTTFLVLLGLCAAGYYLMRRHPSFAANFKGAPRKLVVNESRSLGNRQFLVVVEYENERMLLGVAPGKIDYLCPLRGPHGEPGAFPPIKEGGA